MHFFKSKSFSSSNIVNLQVPQVSPFSFEFFSIDLNTSRKLGLFTYFFSILNTISTNSSSESNYYSKDCSDLSRIPKQKAMPTNKQMTLKSDSG
jgi:hypothetical protein